MKSNPEQKESPVGRKGVDGNYSDNYEGKGDVNGLFLVF
jgi:hypothetical protein